MIKSVVIFVVVAVLLSVLGVLLYRGVRRRLGRRVMPMVILRLCVLCIVALLLVRPGFGCHRTTTRPTLAILLDKSASMSLTDTPDAIPRIESARNLLNSALHRLKSVFKINRYLFAEDVGGGSFDGANADGRATNLLYAVARIARTADAILLLSDGNDTSVSSQNPLPKGIPPVFCIGLGKRDSSSISDLAVRILGHPTRLFRGSTLKVVCMIKAHGFAPLRLPVTLSVDSKTLQRKTVLVRKESVRVVFEVRFDEPGTKKITVSLPPQKGEITHKNNSDTIFIQVLESKIRVFYAEGSLRWEYKFLRQTLAGDPNVEFVGAVHVGEGRFSLQGASKAMTLEGPFPADEEMRKFDVVVIGDMTRAMLSDTQLEKLERFVSDGGTLIFVGGEHILSESFSGTPLEALLPVRLGRVRKVVGRFVPSLTGEGKDHSVFEGVRRYIGSGEAVLETLYVVGAPKPASVVLANHPSLRIGGQPAPVLLFQRYGSGRVVAVMSDTFWRWFFRFRALGRNSPYVRFFGQFLRWAARVGEDSSDPIIIRLSPSIARCGQPVKVAIVPNKALPDSVNAFCGNRRLRLKRTGTELTGVVTIFTPGHYKVRAEGAMRDGRGVVVERELIVGSPSTEWRSITLNEPLLSRLAEHTKGRFVLPPQLDVVVSELEAIAEAHTGAFQPLWQNPWLLLILFGVIFGEWWLRKKFGLV